MAPVITGPVLVTGGTGFIGRRLIARLASFGTPARALVRGDGSVSGAETFRYGGLDDAVGIRRAVAGADSVVHLAARVHVMRDRAPDRLAEFRRVNLQGTRLLAEEAARAGVRRFVLVSTVKAVGEGGEAAMTADTPPAPVDPYGVSKLEAERATAQIAASQGMELVIVRLPLVYGPGMKGNMLSLMRLVDRGMPLPLGAIHNRRSFVFVENVAEVLRLALSLDGVAGRIFYAGEGEPRSTPELIRAMAAALGRRPRLVGVPAGLFRAAGRLGDVLRLPLDSAAVDRLISSLWVDGEPIWTLAGSRPPVSPEQAMLETASWYRAQ